MELRAGGTILKQYATFLGEAHVHWVLRVSGLQSVDRLKKLIVKAWGTLRWLERSWDRGVSKVDLLLSQLRDLPQRVTRPTRGEGARCDGSHGHPSA